MNNALERLTMSGYAEFVWSSFALVLGSLIILYFLSRRRLNKALVLQKQLKEDN